MGGRGPGPDPDPLPPVGIVGIVGKGPGPDPDPLPPGTVGIGPGPDPDPLPPVGMVGIIVGNPLPDPDPVGTSEPLPEGSTGPTVTAGARSTDALERVPLPPFFTVRSNVKKSAMPLGPPSLTALAFPTHFLSHLPLDFLVSTLVPLKTMVIVQVQVFLPTLIFSFLKTASSARMI